MTDYHENREGLSMHWELEKEIPKRVREAMGTEVVELLRRMHLGHPEYVFCLSMECWGRKIPPTTLTANLQLPTPPSGST